MAKILFISNISNGIGSFCLASLNAAKRNGYEFYHAANWSGVSKKTLSEEEKKYGIKIFDVPICRSPFSLKNIRAYRRLKEFIKENNIDFIHCNTPVGGLLGRLVARNTNVKKVIYQAHGFHFYKGAPLLNWLLYYPIEKYLAHKTDVLITINREDYQLASRKFRLKNGGKSYYVPGVGIDLSTIKTDYSMRLNKREELGISPDSTVLVSAGELNKNKNIKVVLQAIGRLKTLNIVYLVCGEGKEINNLKKLCKKLDIMDKVRFMGFRDDLNAIYACSDAFLLSSFREGLSRSLMEAMAFGLPCIVSNIRGNSDLIEDGFGGYLCDPKNATSFAKYIELVAEDSVLRGSMSKFNKEKIQGYSIDVISSVVADIYKKCSVPEI